MATKLPLVEVFYSVQGEGTNAGKAAIFIRYAGCNLDCVFADGSICDTPWRKPRMKITLVDLATLLRAYCSPKQAVDQQPWIIITGGEPTASPTFDDLVAMLRWQGYQRLAVETNGTRWTPALLDIDHICVSPKNLPGINHARPLRSPDPDERVLRAAHELRYVITGPKDKLPEVPEVVRPSVDLFLSPALLADGRGLEIVHYEATGEVPEFVPGAAARVVELVKQNPRWRVSLQTHKWMMVR